MVNVTTINFGSSENQNRNHKFNSSITSKHPTSFGNQQKHSKLHQYAHINFHSTSNSVTQFEKTVVKKLEERLAKVQNASQQPSRGKITPHRAHGRGRIRVPAERGSQK